ncbi:hypothetical protein GWI33_021552 [Rhynchophorus ferrugineus]|uniref:Ras-related protein Rab-36 n=1 Tax=Rhynchophorus ferrugineus TaxID=354439 RepID=A0A834ITL8_RHYFE|nr:hypothetical protein GWI33_021552 [Rhynchophorus ferrugineus]
MEDIMFDRVLNKFILPYNYESTPYLQNNFSVETRQQCNYKAIGNNKYDGLTMSKVIIIGDTSVGKTCLINRYCNKIFDTNYKATIGVDFQIEKFVILGVPYSLQIWDTAGQERFQSIAQSYYRGAHAIVVCFDLSNYESLMHAKKWLKEALNANTNQSPFIFLVGSKKDLINNFTYKNIKTDAVKLAKELNAEFWGVSSKSGYNIEKLFSRIAVLTFDLLIKTIIKDEVVIKPIGNKLVGISDKANHQKPLINCC